MAIFRTSALYQIHSRPFCLNIDGFERAALLRTWVQKQQGIKDMAEAGGGHMGQVKKRSGHVAPQQQVADTHVYGIADTGSVI